MKGVGYLISGLPNNSKGRAFLATLRAHCNFDEYRLRVRGNGPRSAIAAKEGKRGNFYRQDLPASKAKTLRVYVYDKHSPTTQLYAQLRDRDEQLAIVRSTLAQDREDADEHILLMGAAWVQEAHEFRRERDEARQALAAYATLPAWLRWLVSKFD